LSLFGCFRVQTSVQETVQGAENQDQPSHEHDVEGITVMVFNPDVHVVSDPGLRVAIEQFHPGARLH
jgi:hypothetical protein